MRLRSIRQAPKFMSSCCCNHANDLRLGSQPFYAENGMSLKSHLDELVMKHQAMEKELRDASVHPATTDSQIAEIKRRKLKIKDEITRIEREVKQAA